MICYEPLHVCQSFIETIECFHEVGPKKNFSMELHANIPLENSYGFKSYKLKALCEIFASNGTL
jgi:hypothetical protein